MTPGVQIVDRGRRRAASLLVAASVIVALALVIAPAWIIQPFRAQTPYSVAAALRIRGIAPAFTLLIAATTLLLVVLPVSYTHLTLPTKA